MSYTILYRRLGLKTPSGKFIILVQAGDNNVYDVNPRTGREVRSRDWEAWTFGSGMPLVAEEEISGWLDGLKRRAQDAALLDFQQQGLLPATCQDPDRTDWKRHFGWYRGIALGGRSCRNTSFCAVKAFFGESVRKAVPLDEFVSMAGPLKVTYWDKPERAQFGAPKQYGRVETEEQILRAFSEVKALPTLDGGPWLSPVLEGCILDSIADTATAVNRAKATPIKAYIIGQPYEKYVKRVFPLELTEDPGEAFGFAKGLIDGDVAWRAVDAASGHRLRSMIYEKA